jgi:hypothetical protein
LRFLRFAAGAGAATAAIGAAAWAVRKHGEEGSHQTIEEAIAAGETLSSLASGCNQHQQAFNALLKPIGKKVQRGSEEAIVADEPRPPLVQLVISKILILC